MNTAREWKLYYARERAALGEAGLRALLDAAPEVDLPPGGALVFPHTRLAETGDLVAAAALAVLRTGCREVLALGVLHGGREEDTALVQQARQPGGEAARRTLRRVHGPKVPGDENRWQEEFSLDGFCALLELAAARTGAALPRVVRRYPFLVGDTPESLPGLAELREIISRGAAVVATTDPVHHGRGYGDPAEACWPIHSPQAEGLAHGAVAAALEMLERKDYAGFQAITAKFRSDFRDTGPVLACLLRLPRWRTKEEPVLRLVEYAEALGAPRPTWVAAALLTVG